MQEKFTKFIQIGLKFRTKLLKSFLSLFHEILLLVITLVGLICYEAESPPNPQRVDPLIPGRRHPEASKATPLGVDSC